MIMRNFNYLLWTLFLVFTTEINAQLFVKDNSYVYNKGSYIFVKGDVNLESDLDANQSAGIYLRNEGQLLQGGTTVNGENKGQGKLSVFQEGTVNNYAYNYWCSPVGNVTASTTGNRDFGITLLGTPTNSPTATIGFTPATMTGSYNGVASLGSMTIASFWIYKYPTPSISYTGWQSVGSNSTISAGQGFSMKGTSGSDATNVGETATNNPGSNQRYDFRGKPNDGDISINVGADQYTLTGNPYPSAIDLSEFLTDPLNADLDGVAYFWEQDKTINSHNLNQYSGGYSSFNGTSLIGSAAIFSYYDLGGNPVANPSPPILTTFYRRFCPVGQGFMVKGKTGASGNPVRMRNEYRVFRKEGDGLTDPSLTHFEKNGNATNSVDYGFYEDIPNVAGIDYTQISKAPTPHILINSTLNSNAIRQLALGFMDSAIDGVDRADTKNPEQTNNLPYDVYFYLGNTEYIHSVTSFDINKRFPIGFKNNGSGLATFRVQAADIINFTGSEKVYLYDGLTGLYYPIRENYHELNLAPGVYNDRFEITFKNAEALGLDDNLSNNFVIVQNNSNQLLSISNPNALDIKSVALYDILGKLIFNKVNIGTNTTYEFPTTNLSDGVYVVKLETTDNRSLGQKIIVKKNN